MLKIVVSASALFLFYYYLVKPFFNRIRIKNSQKCLSGGKAEGKKYQYGPYVSVKKTSSNCFICKAKEPPDNIHIEKFKGISVIITVQEREDFLYTHGIKIYADRHGKKYLYEAIEYINSMYFNL